HVVRNREYPRRHRPARLIGAARPMHLKKSLLREIVGERGVPAERQQIAADRSGERLVQRVKRLDAAVEILLHQRRELGVAQHAGVAVLRGGLKNGVLTTVAGTRWRTASTVTSNSNDVPSALCGASMVASAMSFFKTGDHVVVVARPTCRPFLYTGTATRDAADAT